MMSLGKPFQHHNVVEAGSVRGSVADPEGARASLEPSLETK